MTKIVANTRARILRDFYAQIAFSCVAFCERPHAILALSTATCSPAAAMQKFAS
jgi:hypothetical protein